MVGDYLVGSDVCVSLISEFVERSARVRGGKATGASGHHARIAKSLNRQGIECQNPVQIFVSAWNYYVIYSFLLNDDYQARTIGTPKKNSFKIKEGTVELRSSGPKSNGNLTPTDLTFGPHTSFSLSIYIGCNRF